MDIKSAVFLGLTIQYIPHSFETKGIYNMNIKEFKAVLPASVGCGLRFKEDGVGCV